MQMDLIKNDPPEQVDLKVGDKIEVTDVYGDGRGGLLTSKARLEVIEVYKLTFDAQDKEGRVYRHALVGDRWKKIA
jgi:hypothetical protein